MTNTNAERVLRLNADGSLDNSFSQPFGEPTAQNSSSADVLAVQPDGKVLAFIGGSSVGYHFSGIRRLNSDGTFDSSFAAIGFNSGRTYFTTVTKLIVLSDGKILIASNLIDTFTSNGYLQRYNSDGTRDSGFESPSLTGTARGGSGNLINDFEVLNDGGIVIVGDFNSVNGVSRANVAKLSAAGNVDLNFAPANVFLNREPAAEVGIFSNGKILVRTGVTNIAGSLGTTNRFVLFNAGGGGGDNSFVSPSNLAAVNQFTVDNADNVLLYGSFTESGGTVNRFARLNSNGNLVSSFAVGYGVGGTVSALAIQTSGKVVIAGEFTNVSGISRRNIARLNADGSLDQTFISGTGFDSTPEVIVAQTDGKILVGGSFTSYNGAGRLGLARLNVDGSLDATFNAGSISAVRLVELQTDGKYLVYANSLIRLNADGSAIVVGSFVALGNSQRANLARLRPDGSVDNSFFPVGANNTVRAVARRPDGRFLVGGDFTAIAGVTRLAAARLTVGQISGRLTPFDFDGDGRADIAVFRPSNGYWYQLRSPNYSFYSFQFGASGDRIAPADYDGDGKTDLAVFRGTVSGAGNLAYFYITNSSDNSFRIAQFGATGDVPVSGDWDGDGKADLAVYRDGSLTGGQSYFFYRPSSQPGADFRSIAWGGSGDRPVFGDFDGDGKLDAAVFRPSNGIWYILKSSNNQVLQVSFGLGTDIPVPADYNGDGVTDIAVFRPSNGYWYIARSSSNASQNFDSTQFGTQGDLPVPADYDGDGKIDIAVYRPQSGAWYLLRSTQGFTGVGCGIGEDRPIPHAYIR